MTEKHFGKIVFLPPWNTFTPSDSGLLFLLQRRQFPVSPAFQRQSIIATLEQVGIDLTQHDFTHGQFNVALSRERFFDSVSVLPSVQ